MKKFLFTALCMLFAVSAYADPSGTPGKSHQADPQGEPRSMGFGEPAGKSADAPAHENDYPGNSDIVGAKG